MNVCSDASIKPKRCAVAIHRVVASTFLHHSQNENNLEVMARLDVDHRVREMIGQKQTNKKACIII